MQTLELTKVLVRQDAKLIGRDRFMLGMFGFIVYIILMLHFGLPWLNNYLIQHKILPSKTIAHALSHYYPLLVGYFALIQGAMIAGMIFGFMLLEEKEGNTILATLVTPVPLRRFVAFRTAIPTLMGFFIVLAMAYGIGLSLLPFRQMAILASGSMLLGPIATLFFATYAENKVQGFAISKFTGIGGFLVLLSWFIPEPYQWLFGAFPPYLIVKAYWMLLEGRPLWWLSWLVGVVLQLGLLAWMLGTFQRAAQRKAS